MFNIVFNRECKQSTEVRAEVNTNLHCERPVLIFTWECGKQYAAALLEQHLCDALAKAIERAHRLAYERGWNDKQKKKRKATDFGGGFEERKDCIAY